MQDQSYIAGKLHQFVIERAELHQRDGLNRIAAQELNRSKGLLFRLLGLGK